MKTPLHKEALKFLMTQKVGVLSTVSEGKPHGSYIYYIADEDFNIYFTTVQRSRKHTHLLTYAYVAFTVGKIKPPCTVQISGRAEVVRDEKIMRALISLYVDVATSDNNYPVPLTKLDWEEGVVMYKITPNWLQWSNFKGSKITGERATHVLINH